MFKRKQNFRPLTIEEKNELRYNATLEPLPGWYTFSYSTPDTRVNPFSRTGRQYVVGKIEVAR